MEIRDKFGWCIGNNDRIELVKGEGETFGPTGIWMDAILLAKRILLLLELVEYATGLIRKTTEFLHFAYL